MGRAFKARHGHPPAERSRRGALLGLLLRHRGRTGLTQRKLASRLGLYMRSIQAWEAGANYPSAQRLEALITVFLEVGGLTVGREAVEAEALWAAALRDAPRMQTPFDHAWFATLLSQRAGGHAQREATRHHEPPQADSASDGASERRRELS